MAILMNVAVVSVITDITVAVGFVMKAYDVTIDICYVNDTIFSQRLEGDFLFLIITFTINTTGQKAICNRYLPTNNRLTREQEEDTIQKEK